MKKNMRRTIETSLMIAVVISIVLSSITPVLATLTLDDIFHIGEEKVRQGESTTSASNDDEIKSIKMYDSFFDDDFFELTDVSTIEERKTPLERNDEISEKGALWRAAENKFTGMPVEEFDGYLGLELDFEKVESRRKLPGTFNTEGGCLPDYFNWMTQHGVSYITPVKDQAACGSCWAFAVIGALEGHIKAYYNDPYVQVNLSEQDLVSCSGAGSCGGGWPDLALDYIQQNGVCNESCFLYTALNDDCSVKCPNWEQGAWSILSWQDVPLQVDDIKNALMTKGPLVTGMEVYYDFFDYEGGVYSHVYGDLAGYHAIVIVGFGSYDGLEYWICKNSWGTDWGEEGYFRIVMGECCIDSFFVHALDAPVPPTPHIVFCNDNDNDGYCNWGIGEKPAYCPCTNIIPDCNDSNASIFEGCGMLDFDYGALHVTSNPPNARVYIKDLETQQYIYRGTTPVTTNLTPMVREVKITKNHYEDVVTTAVIIEEQLTELHIDLLNKTELFYPLNNDIFRAGEVIDIIGTAPNHSNFTSYTVDYCLSLEPSGWSTEGVSLVNGGTCPVYNDTLASWNTSHITNGDFYILRLTVNRTGEQVFAYSTNIYIDPTLKKGWPKRINAELEAGEENYWYWPGLLEPVVSDLDNDGLSEIIIYSGGDPPKIKVFRENGSLYWVGNVGNLYAAGGNLPMPLVGDLDNDGFNEIIAYNFNYIDPLLGDSVLYAFTYSGDVLWHTLVPCDFHPTLLMADVNLDGRNEIIIQGNDAWNETLVIVSGNGSIINQWELEQSHWGASVHSNPAVGNFDEDPELEIVCASPSANAVGYFYESALYVYNIDGSCVDGWPIYLQNRMIFSSPAVGDINNDGEMEIIVGCMHGDGGLYVVNKSGVTMSGWPFGEGLSFWSAPALADFDHDGDLEIVISDCMGSYAKTYVLHHNGSLCAGWPQSILWPGYYSPVVGDVNGDGIADIVETAGDGFYPNIATHGGVFAWEYNGTRISGFPKVTEVDAQAPAVIADIDGDNKVEIIASSDMDYDWETQESKRRGSLYVWEMDGYYNITTMEWPTFHHDNHHTGLYHTEALHAFANGPYPGFVDVPVQFSGIATGGQPPYSWHWNFGDGNESWTQNPNHTFTSLGCYIVTLIVADHLNNTAADMTIAIIIQPNSLVVSANGPYTGYVNEPIQFTSSAQGGIPPYNWTWDFGDGSNLSPSPNPQHIYNETGAYLVTVTVTDSHNTRRNDTALVTISTIPSLVWVDDDFNETTLGWGIDHFNTVQDGVDAVSNHGTIYVFNGVYNDSVLLNKSVNLIGENKNNTIIIGDSWEPVLLLSADNINISKFTIIDDTSYRGIEIASTHNLLSHNIIHANYSGIYVTQPFNTIEGNIIISNNQGIVVMGTSNIIIRDNTIASYPIGIGLAASSSVQLINNQLIATSIYIDGYSLDQWTTHILLNNTVNGKLIRYYSNTTNIIVPTDSGQIILAHCTNMTIRDLNISDPVIGILAGFSHHNTMCENSFTNNIIGLILSSGCEYNTIFHNNFIDNMYFGAYDVNNNNTWYDTTLQEGNYWSDFDEPAEGAWDNDSNGIVDTPYHIPMIEGNQDLYPFIQPNGWKLNHPPVANFTYSPEQPTILDIVQFSDLSIDQDGNITGWHWEFGDGTISYSPNPTHQYNNNGAYLVVLTVWDNENATGTINKTIFVVGMPPLANFSFTPAIPTPNETVFFMDTSVDFDGEIISWWWDFGDDYYSSRQHPKHCYDEEGMYNVSLTVTDSDGAQDTTVKIIVVLYPNNPPNIPDTPTGLPFSISGRTCTFTTTTIDPENHSVFYLFDWGDNMNSGWLGPFVSGETIHANHSWNLSGLYQVRVKAKDIYSDESNWSRSHIISILSLGVNTGSGSSNTSQSERDDKTRDNI
ncbi:MAG: PKD domain-containing protein [Candidatus Thermoplasmatota archaeon]|nr:PKD domain-containing protein [Candidatus Thermoplasmatota archaeon]